MKLDNEPSFAVLVNPRATLSPRVRHYVDDKVYGWTRVRMWASLWVCGAVLGFALVRGLMWGLDMVTLKIAEAMR